MVKVNIRGHEVYLTEEIKEYAIKKLDKLCRKYKTIIDIDLVLEEDHNKTENRAAYAGATVKMQGKDVHANAEARTIFAAIDQLEERLERQLEKDKGVHRSNGNGKFSKSKDIIRKLFRQS